MTPDIPEQQPVNILTSQVMTQNIKEILPLLSKSEIKEIKKECLKVLKDMTQPAQMALPNLSIDPS
jgi:hypothetical protein